MHFYSLISTRAQIGDLIALLIYYVLLSLSVRLFTRDEEAQIHGGHIIALLVGTLVIGFIGLRSWDGLISFVSTHLACAMFSLAFSVTYIGLSYRAGFLIALATPTLFLVAISLGEIIEQCLMRILLT